MRVDRERLILLALAVLMRARERLRRGAFRPDGDLRLALAVLYGFSRSGERACYDAFWANASLAHEKAYSATVGDAWRCNEAHRLFEHIASDVGAPAHVNYRAKVNALARDEVS